MDKKEIIAFFDSLASGWDEYNTRNEEVVAEILERSGIREGIKVLDVACGTGVLFPDYQKAGAEITGIDISENINVLENHLHNLNFDYKDRGYKTVKLLNF